MAPTLDPYTSIAENKDVTLQKNIDDLLGIVKASETSMFTTRSPDGNLHSRAMTHCSPHDNSRPGLTIYFIANNASHKFEEIENDSHCNVSFNHPKTTNWASYSGKAKIIKDKTVIKKYWSPYISAYFGDLKDGIHKGDVNDPRVSLIEVVPDEIRFWVATKGAVGRAIDESLGAVTGHIATPGELRTITQAEVQLTQGLYSK